MNRIFLFLLPVFVVISTLSALQKSPPSLVTPSIFLPSEKKPGPQKTSQSMVFAVLIDRLDREGVPLGKDNQPMRDTRLVPKSIAMQSPLFKEQLVTSDSIELPDHVHAEDVARIFLGLYLKHCDGYEDVELIRAVSCDEMYAMTRYFILDRKYDASLFRSQIRTLLQRTTRLEHDNLSRVLAYTFIHQYGKTFPLDIISEYEDLRSRGAFFAASHVARYAFLLNGMDLVVSTAPAHNGTAKKNSGKPTLYIDTENDVTFSPLEYHACRAELVQAKQTNPLILDLSTLRLGTLLGCERFIAPTHAELNLAHNFLADDSLSTKLLMLLCNLRKLTVSHNQLTTLPVLTALTNLRILDMSSNRCRSLAESIEKLTKLRSFNASHNQISSIPVATLTGLRHLETVDLRDNTLSQENKDAVKSHLTSIKNLLYL